MITKIMLKLISILTGRKIVILTDISGWDSRSLESKKENPNTGRKYCWRCWPFRIGYIDLRPHGKTDTTLIEKWSYAGNKRFIEFL